MIEQRDIKLAIRALVGEGFTSGEIEEAVQNRLVRIPGWHWPGNACSAWGKVGEPGEGTVVGPTYYLIIGRARILRYNFNLRRARPPSAVPYYAGLPLRHSSRFFRNQFPC